MAPYIPNRRYNHKSGVKNIPPSVQTPGDFLSLLITDDMLIIFCEETNKYVALQSHPKWLPESNLTLDELKRWFGISLYMGIVDRPGRYMYWSNTILGDVRHQKYYFGHKPIFKGIFL